MSFKFYIQGDHIELDDATLIEISKHIDKIRQPDHHPHELLRMHDILGIRMISEEELRNTDFLNDQPEQEPKPGYHESILNEIMKLVPVGNIKTHTIENLTEQLAEFFDNYGKMGAKLDEVEEKLEAIINKYEPKPSTKVCFFNGNHTSIFYDDIPTALTALNRTSNLEGFASVEMLSYQGKTYHVDFRVMPSSNSIPLHTRVLKMMEWLQSQLSFEAANEH